MTLNQRLIAALGKLGVPVVADVYTGKARTYITFNYDTIPAQFAGNRPLYWRVLIQVHYFCPLDADGTVRRMEIVRALALEDFTYPEIINATDKDGQHYVFETEAIMKMEE